CNRVARMELNPRQRSSLISSIVCDNQPIEQANSFTNRPGHCHASRGRVHFFGLVKELNRGRMIGVTVDGTGSSAMIEVDADPGRMEHPLRRELHGELHARPSLYFDGNMDVWHLAIMNGDVAPVVPEPLQRLAAASTTTGPQHGIADYEGGRLKWELHTEFLTLTYTAAASEGYSPPPAFVKLRNEIVGQTVTAVRVIVREGTATPFGHKTGVTFVASEVGGGDADVY